MKKQKRTGRKDRFIRIKNKSEQLYKAPSFLKTATGITTVSASGIFQTDERYGKSYLFKEGILAEEIAELCTKLREMDADYGLFRNYKEESLSLLVVAEKKDMQEAADWFACVEQETGLTGMDAERRLEHIAKFLNGILNMNCRADSYLFETTAWKSLAVMDGIKVEDGLVQTAAGVLWVMAVRCYPDSIEELIMEELAGQEEVWFAYTQICSPTDQEVSNRIHSQYLGLDGVLPRMKRSNPSLYHILSEAEGEQQNTKSFIAVSVFFLMRAEDQAGKDQAVEQMKHTAEKKGLLMEELPLAEMKIQSEIKKIFCTFGLTGMHQERYQSVRLSSEIERLLPTTSGTKQKKETYDIEELRALFYKEDRTGQAEPEENRL